MKYFVSVILLCCMRFSSAQSNVQRVNELFFGHFQQYNRQKLGYYYMAPILSKGLFLEYHPIETKRNKFGLKLNFMQRPVDWEYSEVTYYSWDGMGSYQRSEEDGYFWKYRADEIHGGLESTVMHSFFGNNHALEFMLGIGVGIQYRIFRKIQEDSYTQYWTDSGTTYNGTTWSNYSYYSEAKSKVTESVPEINTPFSLIKRMYGGIEISIKQDYHLRLLTYVDFRKILSMEEFADNPSREVIGFSAALGYSFAKNSPPSN
jgi:hypothetical protein